MTDPLTGQQEIPVPDAKSDDCERLRRAEAQRDSLVDALREVHGYLKGDPEYHHRIGEACGVNACIVCLAEGTAAAAIEEGRVAA